MWLVVASTYFSWLLRGCQVSKWFWMLVRSRLLNSSEVAFGSQSPMGEGSGLQCHPAGWQKPT